MKEQYDENFIFAFLEVLNRIYPRNYYIHYFLDMEEKYIGFLVANTRINAVTRFSVGFSDSFLFYNSNYSQIFETKESVKSFMQKYQQINQNERIMITYAES